MRLPGEYFPCGSGRYQLLSLWRVRFNEFRSVPGVSICFSFLDPQFKKSHEEAGSISFGDICCQVVCSAALVFVEISSFHFGGNKDWVKETLTLSKRSSSSMGPICLEFRRVLVLSAWCVTTRFHVMQQLMGLSAEFGIRASC